MTKYRIEKDSIGEVQVPKDKLWGAQTQRSLQNFPIGIEKMPHEIIRAFAIIKKAAAEINAELGMLEHRHAKVIAIVCDEILEDKWDDQFPLSVWQTGSGTQTNMNVNEVIAHRGNVLSNDISLHPNDHVNKGQSSNDTFPAAMHISAAIQVTEKLLPAIEELADTFQRLSMEHEDLIKIGRTHLQDATPLTFGQEISAWQAMLVNSKNNIEAALKSIMGLALGGTAVGTGLNSHKDFGRQVAERIAQITGISFVTSQNKFYSLTSKDGLVFLHGAIKSLAVDLLKIVNDVRWLASGPRCGIGEITIPENEPGSSIMPGKVNPTQCEALSMVTCQVLGNDMAIGVAASQGNFQLNTYMPVIIFNFIQSVRLLSDSILSFNKRCALGIQPNKDAMRRNLENSLMLVTALSPAIGYDKAASVAKYAYKEKITLKEAVLKLGYMTEIEFELAVDPAKMV